mgnify:CR=1 FL=1
MTIKVARSAQIFRLLQPAFVGTLPMAYAVFGSKRRRFGAGAGLAGQSQVNHFSHGFPIAETARGEKQSGYQLLDTR